MTAESVISIYTELEQIGIKIWIDGGWAKDVLIGRQTREHRDLDIAVEKKNLSKLIEYFISQEYAEIARPEKYKWDIVLGDNKGHEIDIHAFSFDEAGNIIDELYWDAFTGNALNGTGLINKTQVRCIHIDHLLKTLDSKKRELRDKDYHDLDLLNKLKDK